MPTQSHRWAFLQSLRDTYTWGTPYVEGYDEYAGLVALFGLLLLLFNLLKPNSSATLQRKLALIVMMGFLLSTIGGLGTLIANWIRPEFRSLNRISIFLCTCGLLSSALAIDSMKRKRSKRIFAEVVFLILLLGMWDQCPRMMKVREDGIKAHLDDTSFFASLENLLPREAMVLQLPFMEFPESPPYYKMGDYEHLVGYLYTKQLRFSYGAIKGREGSETLKKWSTFPFNISFLKEKGFKAIYLDRFGFRDGGSLIQELLTRKIGAPKLSSGDGRRVCWIL